METSELSVEASTRLANHSARRNSGIATISFLRGPFGNAIAAWRKHNSPRAIAIVRSAEIESCLSTWFSLADAGIDEAWKALFPDQPDAKYSYHRRTRFEIEQLLEREFPAEPSPHLNWLIRLLVSSVGKHESLQTFSTLWCDLHCDPNEGLNLVAALSQFVPKYPWPSLFFAYQAREGGSPSEVGRLLELLAIRAPRIPLAFQRDELQDVDIRVQFGSSRVAAMLQEGVVLVTCSTSKHADVEQERRHNSPEAHTQTEPELPSPVLTSLICVGGTSDSTRLACEAQAASSRAKQVGSVEAANQARSAAEQFLFDRLEYHPVTAGRFLLNQQIRVESKHAVDGAERSWEVDLCCRPLDIAVEVDGYYHFQEPEAYRRDRRKDYELQQQGFLVLRFLADDVIPQFENILARIVHAVQLRVTGSKATETS